MESITNPVKVNPPLAVAGLGSVSPPFLGLDRPSFQIHEQNQKQPKKNLRKVNREIEKFFRYQNIYDYEQPQKKPIFQDEAEKVSGAFSIRIAAGGQLVELKKKLGKKPDELGKSKGDIIDGFSRESRNRFIKLLLSIDYKKMGDPLFYTLTYPGAFSNDPRQWHKDLDVFIHRLKREFSNLCGTWRLEPQKRGAPHFCGFLWGCDRLETYEGKLWFSRSWYEVVGSGDEKHLHAGTGIMRVPHDEYERWKLMMYQAKYQTKKEKGGVSQEFDYPVGRYWGAFERKNLAVSIEEFDIDRWLYFKLRRVGKKVLQKRIGKNKFIEAVKGNESGLWIRMSNDDIEKLLKLYVDGMNRSGWKAYLEKENTILWKDGSHAITN
jgi:hypothetical protein